MAPSFIDNRCANARIDAMRREAPVNRDALVVGLALFAMFFGAGNLIFPPYLGMESGTLWPLGLACFVFFDVVVSCVGVFAINNAGGSILSIQNALGKKAGLALNTAAILCVGMLIAPPRCAATTFEMAIAPWFGDAIGLLPFSVAFFAVVLLLTLKPTRIIDVVGKVLTPLLLAGLAAIIIKGIVTPLGTIAPEAQIDSAVVTGVKAGYQTMDALAALPFGILVLQSVVDKGYTESGKKFRIMSGSSILACVLLLAVALGVLAALAVSPESVGAQLPMLDLACRLGTAGVVYAVLLFLGMFGTSVSSLVAVLTYAGQKSARLAGHRTALLLVLTAAAFAGSLFGFGDLIGIVYPGYGYLGMAAMLLVAEHAVHALRAGNHCAATGD